MDDKKVLDSSKEEIVGNTFVEFLIVIVKYRWFLFLFIFIVTVGATSYALLSPKWYKSTASVLTAEKSDLLSSLSGLGTLVKGFSPTKGLAALTGTNETDKFMAILKSQTLIDDVIKKFDLKNVYDLKNDYYEKVVKVYNANVELILQDEGNLTVVVYDKLPQRAADMANYIMSKLDERNRELTLMNARSNKTFIEKRYKQNLRDIDSLETAMKIYQTKTGVVAIPEQIESTIKSMSEIYGEYLMRDVELSTLKRQMGDDNPKVEAAKIQVDELNKKISKLNAGIDNSQKDSKFLIPFKQAPELAGGYLKIYKDLQIQYKILELVTPMYEQAKVEEQRDTPSLLILDSAYPADRKAKPKGTIFALVGLVVSVLLGLFIVFTLELFNKIKIQQPDRYEYITGWLKFRKNKK